jgi:hypothetical protein
MSALLSSRSMRITVAICLIVAVLTGAAYLLLYHGPARLITHSKNEALDAGEKSYALGKRIVSDIKEKFDATVIVNNRTVIESTAEIAELATVEKTFEQEHSVETTWLGSTKRFRVRAHFQAKAGFDLKNAIRLDISPNGETVRMILPQPRLLSLEQKDISIIEDENGFWNKITKEQREQALQQLTQQARETIAQSGILDEARLSFEQQISEIIRRQLPEGASLSIDIPEQSDAFPSATPPPKP